MHWGFILDAEKNGGANKEQMSKEAWVISSPFWVHSDRPG